MGAEGELLRRIQVALGRADLEADALVDEAWQAARSEVRAVLQRAFQHELLERVAHALDAGSPREASPGSAEVPGPPAASTPPAHHAQTPASPPPAEPAPAEPAPAADPAPPTEPARPVASAAPTEPAPGAEPIPPTAPERVGADPAGPASAGRATYVFGFTRTSVTLEDDLPRVPGGGPIRAVDRAELRAVVCDADPDVLRSLEDLGPEDLDRLAAAAHAHDEVLARVAAQAPVVPLRLGTVLADDAVVRDLLAANGEALTAELGRVDGHAEWAVVVRIPDGGPADDRSETESDSGGDYLRRRQASLSARETRWAARERLADEVHDRLSTFAVAAETIERRPLEQVPPALHGVYLLTWDQIGPFEDAVDEARRAHPEAIIEATGPWPAYHFTSVDLSLDGRTTS
jgi:hypothetical protein